MAAALVDHARSLAIEPKPENVSEFQSFPGEGIHGNIDGNDIYIGNRKIALRAGCGTGESLHFFFFFFYSNLYTKHYTFILNMLYINPCYLFFFCKEFLKDLAVRFQILISFSSSNRIGFALHFHGSNPMIFNSFSSHLRG